MRSWGSLIPYLKENGYNYVELLPLSEHPSDESWGYQNTGFLRPPPATARRTACAPLWINAIKTASA